MADSADTKSVSVTMTSWNTPDHMCASIYCLRSRSSAQSSLWSYHGRTRTRSAFLIKTRASLQLHPPLTSCRHHKFFTTTLVFNFSKRLTVCQDPQYSRVIEFHLLAILIWLSSQHVSQRFAVLMKEGGAHIQPLIDNPYVIISYCLVHLHDSMFALSIIESTYLSRVTERNV